MKITSLLMCAAILACCLAYACLFAIGPAHAVSQSSHTYRDPHNGTMWTVATDFARFNS